MSEIGVDSGVSEGFVYRCLECEVEFYEQDRCPRCGSDRIERLGLIVPEKDWHPIRGRCYL